MKIGIICASDEELLFLFVALPIMLLILGKIILKKIVQKPL